MFKNKLTKNLPIMDQNPIDGRSMMFTDDRKSEMTIPERIGMHIFVVILLVVQWYIVYSRYCRVS